MATAINLFKPFHIDDAYHLKAAQWILEDPFRPMSGVINWSGHLEHFHQGNQPPFFFYCMAIWGKCFGFSEVSMHLLLSLFTGLSILYFHGAARILAPGNALFLTALLVVGPAFLVNQNVMLDIPMLAMICAILFHLVRFIQTPRTKDLVCAAIWLSIGILTKYTVLALVPVVLLVIWLGGRSVIWIASIPLLTVFLWSIWNWFEFEGIHLFGRELEPPSGDRLHIRIVSWLMTLGAIMPWFWITVLVRRQQFIWPILGSIVAFMFVVWLGLIDQAFSDRVLPILFSIIGAAVIIVLFFTTKKFFELDDVYRKMLLLLILSIASLATFTILFAPWMATRHLLLVLPMFLLHFAPVLRLMQPSVRLATLGLTAILGILLAISDIRFALFYQDSASVISRKYEADRVWFLGSLGWGWYAEQAGMRDLAVTTQMPIPGDLIAIPLDFSSGIVPTGIAISEVVMIVQDLGPFDRLSTRTWLRFYSARFPDTPWNITQGQPERILLQKVQ